MVPFAMIPKPTGTALVKRTHPLSMNIQFKWPDPQNFLSKSSVYSNLDLIQAHVSEPGQSPAWA